MILDLGCGGKKHKYPNSVCIDRVSAEGVDIVCDLNKGIPQKNNSVDLIYTSHTLEHLEDLIFIMKEIYRVLKKDGQVIIKVPHFSNGVAYGDPSHKRVFSILTFDNFGYHMNNGQDFKIIEKQLIFHCGFFNRLLNFFNKHQYLYERFFCWIFPCYEIKFILKKI